MISDKDKKQLLEFARQAIVSHFNKSELSVPDMPLLKEMRGVFITLKKNNQLRGCIGFPEPIMELGEAIPAAARAAAFEDPRFPPLEKDELDGIKIEISVLTKPELIKVKKPEEYFNKIKIGEDGLIIRKGFHSGLLLPQVPVEWNWDVKEFLKHTCMKANLPVDTWQTAELYKFQAEVLGE